VKIKIIDLNNVKLPRVNNRYYGNFALKREYQVGKQILVYDIIKNTQSYKLPDLYKYVAVYITVSTHLDIDSYLKPLMDAMQEAGVIDNDKNIVSLHVEKTIVKRTVPNRIEVWIEFL
jgi:Holliday junction resolvase RusA-like endonuclease